MVLQLVPLLLGGGGTYDCFGGTGVVAVGAGAGAGGAVDIVG